MERWKETEMFFCLEAYSDIVREDCVFFRQFFSSWHGGMDLGGHPSHLCHLFLAKGMKVVKGVEGLIVFSTFFYHYAGQNFFSKVVENLRI